MNYKKFIVFLRTGIGHELSFIQPPQTVNFAKEYRKDEIT